MTRYTASSYATKQLRNLKQDCVERLHNLNAVPTDPSGIAIARNVLALYKYIPDAQSQWAVISCSTVTQHSGKHSFNKIASTLTWPFMIAYGRRSMASVKRGVQPSASALQRPMNMPNASHNCYTPFLGERQRCCVQNCLCTLPVYAHHRTKTRHIHCKPNAAPCISQKHSATNDNSQSHSPSIGCNAHGFTHLTTSLTQLW